MNDLVVVQTNEWDFAHFKDDTGKRWYDLGRIAKSLGLIKVDKLADRIPEQHKRLVKKSDFQMQAIQTQQDFDSSSEEESKSQRGGAQSRWFVDEAGMYRAIMRSDSPKADAFTEWVTAEVIPSIISTGTYTAPGIKITHFPVFLLRYAQNQDRVAPGYFSVISELMVLLNSKLELAGHIMADKGANGKELRPDVSVGKRWAKYLEEHYPEHAGKYKMYMHFFNDGTEVEARMYEDCLLALFRKYVATVWMKECAYQYFIERDPKALDYLIKLIPDMKIPHPEIEDRQPQLQRQ